MYVIRILIDKPVRFVLTVTGIAFCIILILFILGIYNGVAEGSIEYIKKTPADIWVLQGNNNNIIRGTSIIPANYVNTISRDSLVESADAVLLFFTNIITKNDSTTVLLTGYTPGGAGGPPKIVEGREIFNNAEIVLDESFAKKHNLEIGDDIFIQGDVLGIVGISTCTNAIVTQYAFVTLEYAQSIIQLPGLASFFIVKVKSERNIHLVINNITKKFSKKFSLFTNKTFLNNNIREMEAGIVPLFFAIAIIGGIVLAIILSLILSVNILEKRKDLAIMKILGSSQWFLDKLIVFQSLTISITALFFGVAAFFPLLGFIEYVSPEVTARVGVKHILMVSFATILIGLLSSLLACGKTRGIYPLEVFK
jgi:ABC-type antimicrobial peptide transport system permease subunit